MRELGLQKAAGALGAFVSGIGLADVAASEQVYIQVREALNKHEVLFFRDQDRAPEVFAAFAKCFGDILDFNPIFCSIVPSQLNYYERQLLNTAI